jgi:hypothetical protein
LVEAAPADYIERNVRNIALPSLSGVCSASYSADT